MNFKKFKNLKTSLPRYSYLKQYLYTFRGEPVITNLDWPFTPNNKSSQDFATSTSSV